MASYNRVILVGNLTRDPEIRYIPSGTAVCDIGLAVNEKYKNAKGEWVEQATFVDVVLWARTAEVASEYLSKGSQVMIEGRLKLDTWEKDGEKKSKLRVVCDRMLLNARVAAGRGRSRRRWWGGGTRRSTGPAPRRRGRLRPGCPARRFRRSPAGPGAGAQPGRPGR
jgi:single-strand DNA-binding protein